MTIFPRSNGLTNRGPSPKTERLFFSPAKLGGLVSSWKMMGWLDGWMNWVDVEKW